MSSFGRFVDNGREYEISDILAPPRPLINFAWNDQVISGVNQFGSGEGVFNNQTFLFNDPAGRARMIKDGRRYFYLRDQDNGAYWNAGFFPVKREPFTQRTYAGVRYTRFVHECEGIHTETLCFVAPDEPVELWKLIVANLGTKARHLKIYPYVEWLLQGYPIGSDYISYLRSVYHPELNAVVSDNTSDERPHRRYTGFVAADLPASSWAGSPRQFLGVYGDPARPESVIRGACPARATSNEWLAGALEIPLELRPGESRELRVLIGNSSDDLDETRRLVGKLLAPGYFEAAFDELLAGNEAVAGTTVVDTPEPGINRLVNRWAKTQVQLCSEFGRDGARGFRDTLQDAWGIVSFKPALAREKMVEALHYQLEAGWALRGWMPVNDRHYSDGPTWIAPAVTDYIKHTGNWDLLDKVVPYYDQGEATVLDHLLCGLRHLHADRGERGLCRAHRGDWNDSLDWMGQAGRGESVMTSMGLFHSCRLVAEMAREMPGRDALVREMDDMAADIRTAVEEMAWDGDWYLQGYSDAGVKVGCHSSESGKIFLPPQAWAVYSGIGSPGRLDTCIESVLRLLESDHGCLVSSPAYTKADPNVGRLTVILPGTYENASPYCHGTAFMIAALCKAGRPDDALRLYRKVMPDSPEHPSEISGVEPWAFTNQYLGPDNLRAGTAVSGWITGTAGWMYNNVIKSFLGFRPGYTGVYLEPCLPSTWPEASLTTTVRGSRYAIQIRRNPDGMPGITVNGKPLAHGFFPYDGKGAH